MKIYIITDLEGIAGVARWDQTGTDQPGYAQATRLMTEEVRACVAGIQSVEADAEIWVWDAHGPGSIDLERFPRGARLLNRGPISPPAFLDSSFDAVFFLGQHSRAGTPNGNLAHTYSSQNYAWFKINGLELGEFGCRAALAGSLGVPTIFVSGDDTMMAEARALIPDIHGAQVKIGLGPQLSLHMAPEDARDLVRDTAADAASALFTAQPGDIKLFTIDGPPYEQQIRIVGRTDPNPLLRQGFTQVDGLTFSKRAERLQDLHI